MLRSVAALALLAGAASAAAAGPRITLEGGVVRVQPAAAASTLEVFVEGPAGLPAAARRDGAATAMCCSSRLASLSSRGCATAPSTASRIRRRR